MEIKLPSPQEIMTALNRGYKCCNNSWRIHEHYGSFVMEFFKEEWIKQILPVLDHGSPLDEAARALLFVTEHSEAIEAAKSLIYTAETVMWFWDKPHSRNDIIHNLSYCYMFISKIQYKHQLQLYYTQDQILQCLPPDLFNIIFSYVNDWINAESWELIASNMRDYAEQHTWLSSIALGCSSKNLTHPFTLIHSGFYYSNTTSSKEKAIEILFNQYYNLLHQWIQEYIPGDLLLCKTLAILLRAASVNHEYAYKFLVAMCASSIAN